MIISYKVVNEYDTKGIIVTSDTIMDLRRWLSTVQGSSECREGAKAVIDFLEDSYRKALR